MGTVNLLLLLTYLLNHIGYAWVVAVVYAAGAATDCGILVKVSTQ